MEKSEMAAVRRGYLLGLEDGYVHTMLKDQTSATVEDVALLYEDAQVFVNKLGDKYFQICQVQTRVLAAAKS